MMCISGLHGLFLLFFILYFILFYFFASVLIHACVCCRSEVDVRSSSINSWPSLIAFIDWFCVCRCVIVRVREQPPLNSGLQTWHQAPLYSEPSCWSSNLLLRQSLTDLEGAASAGLSAQYPKVCLPQSPHPRVVLGLQVSGHNQSLFLYEYWGFELKSLYLHTLPTDHRPHPTPGCYMYLNLMFAITGWIPWRIISIQIFPSISIIHFF